MRYLIKRVSNTQPAEIQYLRNNSCYYRARNLGRIFTIWEVQNYLTVEQANCSPKWHIIAELVKH